MFSFCFQPKNSSVQGPRCGRGWDGLARFTFLVSAKISSLCVWQSFWYWQVSDKFGRQCCLHFTFLFMNTETKYHEDFI